MKKIIFLPIAFALFAMTACSRTEDSIDVMPEVCVTSITAFISDAPDSRTTAETGADGSIQMLWNTNDEVLVTDLSVAAPFVLRDGAKSNCGIFGGSIASTSQNMYGVYPASAASFADGVVKVTLPNFQTYAASESVDTGARNLMLGATSNASTFDFYTVAAMARFAIKVDADETIHSVEMRVEDGYLSGIGVADLQNHTLGNLDKRNVILNYAEPATGVSEDGWVLIAPVDFTSTSGKVYYDVTTNKGKYTFCRKPAKAMRAGMVYRFPLDKTAFTQVASSSELADGKYCFTSNDSTLTVNMLRATDTTIAIGWSANGFPKDYSVDIADSYELYLYNERNQLLLAWQPNNDLSVTGAALFQYSESNPTFPPRFIFTGLTPNTIYKVQVKNLTTSKKSAMLTVATRPVDCVEPVSTATDEGDVLLFENFGKLVWNGDITTQSAGYIYTSYSSITDIADGTAWGNYTSSSQTTYKYTVRDREQQLFTTYKSVVESCGLGDWAWWRNADDSSVSSTSCAVLARPGYLKIGISKVRAGIVTPEMTPLLGTATVRVTFKACTYGTLTADNTSLGVMAIDGCTVADGYGVSYTKTLSTKALNISDNIEWNNYSVELSGVTPTSRIVIFANANSVSSQNNRFHIDDIKVELVKYDGSVSTDIPVARQVASSPRTATIEWTEVEQASRKYTVSIYNDSACTDKYQEYSTSLSTSTSYIKWPARFTFTCLEPKTTYYATVTDLAGNVSRPVAVTTSALPSTGASTEVLYEGFDNLCWGGDYVNMANSATLNTSKVTISTYKPSALTDAIPNMTSTTAPTTDASRITSYTSEVVGLFGLTDWTSEAAHVRPGYVKLGTASAAGSLTTPYLYNFSGSNVKITVSFKACPFIDGASSEASEIKVSIIDDGNNVKSSQTVSLGGRRNEPGWGNFSVDFTSVNAGDRVRFESATSSHGRVCIDDILISSTSAISGDIACGYITDTDGNPLSGVSVSDGYSVTQTNASGYYSLKAADDAWYIYYSVPEDCEVSVNGYGAPDFYQRYSKSCRRYDFTLTKLAGGKESQFHLFCFADPQCRSQHVSRFTSESVPDIKSHVATKTLPCYGVTLGDIVYSEGRTNTVSNMPNMRSAMNKSKTGLPIFQTMGNHDYTYFYSTTPISADEQSSTANLKCQREFENVFGPINHSWNRGDVHIVCMRDIIYNSTTDASNYSLGFTDEQYEWLKQDLSYVPTSKMVILCVHIPIINSSNKNVQNVLTLIKKYSNSQIMSGHTHYMRNEPTRSGVYEHVHAAVCGSWWYSNLNGDGCPNGYSVYTLNGNKMEDWYYKGVNTGMNTRDYQIRLYRGNHKCGGSYEYFQWQHGSGVLLANVFNADSGWTIKVYEDGTYTGNMTLISNKKYDNDTLPYNSKVSPTMVPSDSSQDWWAIGYNVGVVGRGHKGGNRNSYMTNGFHLYKYTLKNASASVRVEAIDRFGNVYESSKIMNDLEYPNCAAGNN